MSLSPWFRQQKGIWIPMRSFFTHLSKLTICLLCVIWIAVIAGILLLVPGSITPLFSGSIVNSAYPDTVTLSPGDVLTQELTVPEGTLENISLAFSYDPEQAQDAQVLISVLSEDTVVMEQPLPLTAIPPSSFFTFSVVDRENPEAVYTVRIENTSEAPDQTFSVPYTTTPNLSTASFSDFSVNGLPHTGKISCGMQYLTGYAVYPACCIVFCCLLSGLILSTLLLHRSSHRQ